MADFIVNVADLVTAAFPSHYVGHIVFVTIYDAAGVVVVPRTADGVVDYGHGVYGKILSFSALGTYLVLFKVDATSVSAIAKVTVTTKPAVQVHFQTLEESKAYNAKKFVTRTEVRKSTTGNFGDPDIVTNKEIEYNPDDTIKSIRETVL